MPEKPSLGVHNRPSASKAAEPRAEDARRKLIARNHLCHCFSQSRVVKFSLAARLAPGRGVRGPESRHHRVRLGRGRRRARLRVQIAGAGHTGSGAVAAPRRARGSPRPTRQDDRRPRGDDTTDPAAGPTTGECRISWTGSTLATDTITRFTSFQFRGRKHGRLPAIALTLPTLRMGMHADRNRHARDAVARPSRPGDRALLH